MATVKVMLDCWAAVLILRAGGCWDVPTLDAATGQDERDREILDAARMRMQGWAESDKQFGLYHDEAVSLSVAEALLRFLESGAPKTGHGKPAKVRSIVASVGKRGPAETFMLAIEAEQLMRAYCESTGESLDRIKQAVARTHPRKGQFSGMGQREGAYRYRCNAGLRRRVSKFVCWAGAEVPTETGVEN